MPDELLNSEKFEKQNNQFETNEKTVTDLKSPKTKVWIATAAIAFLFLVFGLVIGLLINTRNILPPDKTQLTEKNNSQNPTVKDNIIKIGGIMPLTTDAASFGIPIQQAAILAQKEINLTGGIDGKMVEIIWKDGKCNKDDAIPAAEHFLNDNRVDLIIAGACSSEFLNSAPIAQAKKIISFTSSATSPKISELGKYVFRTAPSDKLAGKAAAQYAFNKWQAAKAAIITENKDYTLGLRAVFSENFKEIGGMIVIDEIFETGDTDFSQIAAKIKNADIDVIYILPQSPTPGVLLVKSLKDHKITAKILTAEVLLIRDALTEQGDILEGVTGIEVLFDENRPKAKNFIQAYKREYNQDPTYPGFMAGMYDIIYLIKEAYESGASTSDQLAGYFYNLKNWEGAVGALSFDSQGDPVMTYSIKQISNHTAPQIDTYTPKN